MSTIASAPRVLKPTTTPEQRAAVNPKKFGALIAQLALLWVVFWQFDVGMRDDEARFLVLASAAFVGFVVHYFAPFKLKKVTFLLVSLAGAFLVLRHGTGTTGLLGQLLPAGAVLTAIGLGLAFYATLRLPIAYWTRIGIVLAITAGLAWMRLAGFLPTPFFLVLGPLFMFRMIVYAYEVKSAKKPESLLDFATYFAPLPNFYFVLFPVIDYTTFKKSFYADDIHTIAQRGVSWMVRGTVQLLLYRVIYHNLVIGPEDVHGWGTLIQYLIVPFWLYLMVSGTFHIIIGMMHLFGYGLPETNRRYFLASSFTDFWRRINIYWKDFMVKVFYYPVYFRLRKKSETAALVVATAWVFFATTVLHGYQMFWLRGDPAMNSADYAFWGALGGLVMYNVLREAARAGKKKQALKGNAPAGNPMLRRVLSTIGVYLTISVLWSMWSSQDVLMWLDTIQFWR